MTGDNTDAALARDQAQNATQGSAGSLVPW